MSEQVHFDVFSIISTVGIGLLVFLSVIVLSRKSSNHFPKLFLALLLMCIACSEFNAGIVLYTGLLQYIPHVVQLTYLFIIMIGPLLYFYVYSLKTPDFRLTPRYLLHLLPLAVLVVWKLPFLLLPGHEKIAFMNRWLAGSQTVADIGMEYFQAAFIILVNAVYLAVTMQLVRQKKNQAERSDDRSMIDQWIRISVRTAVFMFLFCSAFLFAISMLGMSLNVFFRLEPIAVTICGFLLAVRGLTLPESFYGTDAPAQPASGKEVKYRSLNISEEKAVSCFAALEGLFRDDRIYLNPALTVADVAHRLSIPRSYISLIVSRYAGCNFFDFVNRHRFKEAKRIMLDSAGRKKSMIDIAYESGFNSKSTFYSYFKKIEGRTPQEYLEAARKSVPSKGIAESPVEAVAD